MAQLIGLSEPTNTMTFADGLAFIERTRRQVERFEMLPREQGQRITEEDAALLRELCDDLEVDINRSLASD